MRKKHLLIGIATLLVIIVITAFTPPKSESYSESRIISAPKYKAWTVISDVGNYHKYATGLTAVSIVSGQGEGMIRSCSDELGSWNETCTAWDNGTSYSFDVDTNSGFPYPMRKMMGSWSVLEIDEKSSKLLIEFEYQLQYRWMNWMFNKTIQEAFQDGNKTLLDNWEKRITLNQQSI